VKRPARPRGARFIASMSRDLLKRIRRAEWVQDRKERETVKPSQRPAHGASWSQIVQAMR